MTACAICRQPITSNVYRDAAARPRCEAHRDREAEAAQASPAANRGGLYWMRGEEITRERREAAE